jgi:hypothetical protein
MGLRLRVHPLLRSGTAVGWLHQLGKAHWAEPTGPGARAGHMGQTHGPGSQALSHGQDHMESFAVNRRNIIGTGYRLTGLQ